MPLNPILNGAANISTSQVSVLTSVTPIIGARSTRRGVIFQNLTGTSLVYFGVAGVTTTTGYPLPAMANATLYIPTNGAVYGISSSITQTVAVMEVYD